MDENGDTIQEAVLRWLENNPSWWSRSEIALGVGRKKTSQLIRVLGELVKAGFILECVVQEHERALKLYRINVDISDTTLPF